MYRIVALCLAASSVLGSLTMPAPALAQNGQEIETVALTEDSASRALDALPDVYAVARSYKDRVPRESSDSPLSGVANFGLYRMAKADLDGAAGSHGFSDYTEWLQHITSLFQAHAFAQSAGAMAAAAPAMRAAMEKLQKDPNIPEAQKQAMLAQLSQMAGVNSATSEGGPSEQNQEIARRLAERIDAVTKAMRESR